jgi:putative oligomerization/nucleic acid binding protein
LKDVEQVPDVGFHGLGCHIQPVRDRVVGSVQDLSGAAASEMLGALFGSGGAEAIAEMRARAGDRAASDADPAERLARLRTLRDSGVLTEAEYEAQRQKIISAI